MLMLPRGGTATLPVLTPNTSVALTNTSGSQSESAARASYSRLLAPASLDCRRSETECRVDRASSYERGAASADSTLVAAAPSDARRIRACPRAPGGTNRRGMLNHARLPEPSIPIRPPRMRNQGHRREGTAAGIVQGWAGFQKAAPALGGRGRRGVSRVGADGRRRILKRASPMQDRSARPG